MTRLIAGSGAFSSSDGDRDDDDDDGDDNDGDDGDCDDDDADYGDGDDYDAIDYCDDDKVMIMYLVIRLHLQLVRVFYYHINLFVKCYSVSCIEATLCITEIIQLAQLK